MNITVNELADKIDAQIIGDSDETPINSVATLCNATKGSLSFLASAKFIGEAKTSQASAILVPREIAGIKPTQLFTSNPYLSWAKAVDLFRPDRSSHLSKQIDKSSYIHPTASIEADVHIGANAVVGANTAIGSGCIIHSGVVIEENCQIGNDVEIHPNAVIHYQTTIGDRCVIWSNAVIGGYGFGNAKDGAKFVRIHQLGNVILENDVAIGCGATVDRGALDDTILKRGVKIDNLVMIAHNVIIGEDTAIAAQTGVSGSTEIGDRVLIGGQAGVVGHIQIGNDSYVGAQAGVSKSFPGGTKITGYPARNLMDVRRSDTAITHLPELLKRVKKLEKKLEDMGCKEI